VTARHPEPPADPASLRLLIRRVSRRWRRIHLRGRDALHFGKQPRHRFDAPAGEFGVLYVGGDVHCTFIETFGHDTGRVPFVTEAELRAREIAIIRADGKLRLADLRGEGLARIGADAALTSGTDYGLSRRWARALYDHPRRPDGILYRARHDPARTSAAIFDRAASRLSTRSGGCLVDAVHEVLLSDILETYKYGLVPS
jgi:hypothetical protein